MKHNKMISNSISFFIFLALIGLLIPTLVIPFWVLKIKTVEKEVDLITRKSHQETWSLIQHATTISLPLKSSASNIAKLTNLYLGKPDPTFSDIESKVSPLMFQALLTTLHLTQISYIRKDGLFFSLYFKNRQQIFAIYSNTSFSKVRKYSWYTRPVDSDSGKLFGDAILVPPQFLVDETWLQQALNATNGCPSLGKSLNDVNNLIVLNTAGVDKNGVISLGFDLRSLMDLFSGIKPSNGGLYLATKDGKMILEGNKTISSQLLNRNHGNFTWESQILEISGRKYIVHSSTLDIIGVELMYVLALPYDGLESTMHKNIVFVFLLLLAIFVTVAISIFNFVVLMVRAARKEMCLKAALIKQKEATQQAERKGKNQSLAFVSASHDIRASLAGIAGLLEISIHEVDRGSELEKNLRLVQICSEDLYGILNVVLDTSKIEAGKMELEEKQFDLIKAVEEVVELFYPVALKKGVDVILDLQEGRLTKFSQVKGDERRLKQILSNLLSNAVKFTSEGNVSVRAWTRKPRLQNSRFDSTHDRPTGCLFFKSEALGDLEAMDEIHLDPSCMEFVFEVDDTGKGIPKEKQASVFENYVQVKETAPELEGTGLGLGIVQSLVRLMGGEISIVDKEVGEKGTCFRFNVIFHVCVSDSSIISEDEKSVKSTPDLSSGPNTPFCSPKQRGCNSSIVVLFISSDERRRMTHKFLAAHGIKVLAVESIGQLSETLRGFRQEQQNICSSRSDLSLSFGYLTWPTPKGAPLSALDGTGRSNRGSPSNFVLIVIDTTRVDFPELCKAVAEFRKDSKNVCSRIVWLGSRCIQLQGLDEKKLPPSDIIIPMPLHGSRLHSLLGLLPEFGSKFPGTPPHPHQRLSPMIKQNPQEIVRTSMSSSSPLRGKKVLVAEDDSLQQMIAKKILSKLGVTLEMCGNGKEALTIVTKGLSDQRNLGASHILPFEYILMDCEMPEMDGCEATRLIRLKEKDYGVHIPIIGLTAHGEGQELNNFFGAGIDSHISKPLNEQKILKVIEDLHRRR